ncbi:MAG: hypothetical protein ABSA12_00125 [Verrucomicrobiia bacterium]|jgi:hypothetical protein
MGSLLLVLLPAIALLIYANLDGHILKNLDPGKKWLPKLLIFCTLAACFLEIYKDSVDSNLAAQAKKQAEQERQANSADRAHLQAMIDRLGLQLENLKKENTRLASESQEKLEAARIQLTKAVSDAEIRAIQSEFSEWAEAFATNASQGKATLDNLKAQIKAAQALAKEQEEASYRQDNIQALPATSFAVQFLQQSVQAYAERTGQQIRIEPLRLPDNLYKTEATGHITFTSGAVWSLRTYATGRCVWFVVNFTGSDHADSGELDTAIDLPENHVAVSYHSPLPLLDPSTVDGHCPIDQYETLIKKAYFKVLETQLLQALK